jgi:hypothetical protein
MPSTTRSRNKAIKRAPDQTPLDDRNAQLEDAQQATAAAQAETQRLQDAGQLMMDQGNLLLADERQKAVDAEQAAAAAQQQIAAAQQEAAKKEAEMQAEMDKLKAQLEAARAAQAPHAAPVDDNSTMGAPRDTQHRFHQSDGMSMDTDGRSAATSVGSARSDNRSRLSARSRQRGIRASKPSLEDVFDTFIPDWLHPVTNELVKKGDDVWVIKESYPGPIEAKVTGKLSVGDFGGVLCMPQRRNAQKAVAYCRETEIFFTEDEAYKAWAKMRRISIDPLCDEFAATDLGGQDSGSCTAPSAQSEWTSAETNR